MVETGASDGAARDDGRRVAAFCGELAIAARRRSEDRHRLRSGPEQGRSAGRRRARRQSPRRKAQLAATRASWADAARPGRGRDQPARFRPAGQHLAALSALCVAAVRPRRPEPARRRHRLSRSVAGRAAAGPHRTPADAGADRAARRASSSAKATCSNGGIARPTAGQVSASGPRPADPHLWLPYVLARYVAQTGDRTVLDETTPFLEGEAVPAHEDTWIVIPRASRESGDVYEHADARSTTRSPSRRERPAAARRRRLERRHRRAWARRGIGHQRLDGLLPLRRARRLHSARAPERGRSVRRPLRGGARRAAPGARSRLARRPLRARLRRRRTRASTCATR